MQIGPSQILSLETASLAFYELRKVRVTGERWESTKIV